MRPICSGCDRPLSVCLCDVMPSPPPNLRTRLLILQHPHELKHKLATVPVLSRCVHPCHVVVGRRLHSANWPFSLSDDSEPDAHHTLLLFPAPDAVDLRSWYEVVSDQEGAECAAPVSIQGALARSIEGSNTERNGNEEDAQYSTTVEHPVGDNKLKCSVIGKFAGILLNERQTADSQITLVVLDGTWEHAQEMFKASLPFLSNFVTQVCLPFDLGSEGYGVGESDLIIRKEPFGGCVSTMEAIARALAVLEPDGHILEHKLMNVLRRMVSLQSLHFSSPKVRQKLKKKSKVFPTNAQSVLAGE